MKFHLNHTPAVSSNPITHSQRLMLMGSCFSDNIGSLLKQHGFNVIVNPAGIAYDPFSIIEHLHGAKIGREDLILESLGLFFSYLHHSSIHDASKLSLVEKLKKIHENIRTDLAKCQVLLLTFGTAFVYEHKSIGSQVANCHKQPGALFNKRMLQVSEIVAAYKVLLKHLHAMNPGLRIVFTVSPVKHLKDGLRENTLSKASLHLAVDELCREHDFCSYFPAYELVNDDLRDHRFYKVDLAHPNAQAIEYIWEKFSGVFFNENTRRINSLHFKLSQALQHRPLLEREQDNNALSQHIAWLREELKRLHPGTE